MTKEFVQRYYARLERAIEMCDKTEDVIPYVAVLGSAVSFVVMCVFCAMLNKFAASIACIAELGIPVVCAIIGICVNIHSNRLADRYNRLSSTWFRYLTDRRNGIMGRLIDEIEAHANLISYTGYHPITIVKSRITLAVVVCVDDRNVMGDILGIIRRHPYGGMCMISMKGNGARMMVSFPTE